MNKTFKNIIIILVLVFGLGGLYLAFFGNSENPTGSLQSSNGLMSVSEASEQINADTAFLSTLLGLTEIRIEKELFSNASFKNLKDNSVEIIIDVEAGRPNPFAPFDSAPADTSTTLPPLTTIELDLMGNPINSSQLQ